MKKFDIMPDKLGQVIPDFDSKSGFPQKNINDIQESVWGIIKV